MTLKTVEKLKERLLRELEQIMEAEGISQGEVARRTGMIRTNVNQIMRRKAAASLDVLIKIAESVGLMVEIRFRKSKD